MPLVSCIMPTRNRRRFIGQALRYFARQTYPNRELIIVDDGDDPIADLLPPDDAGIVYLRLPDPAAIGVKRNLACDQARGSIIAHWDDDDWYAPHRLWHQVQPLLDGSADVTGLETACFYDPVRQQGWACSPWLHRRLFVHDVHGGTLVYWRRLWERLARYPAVSLAEDALFLKEVCRHGARLEKRPNDGAFVYVRHGANAWRFEPGRRGGPEHWQAVDPAAVIPQEDRAFYAGLAAPAPAGHVTAVRQATALAAEPPVCHTSPACQEAERTVPAGPALPPRASAREPLVTCIMPTYNRRAFMGQAIAYFQGQDYLNRELLILDDGEDAVADLVPSDPRIRYVRLDRRLTLGGKRNLASELAHGSVIVHWDDDDWMASHRVRAQVATLLDSGADVCGVSQLLYYEPSRDRAWLYVYPLAGRRWVAGNTLAYRRSYWQEHPFAEVAVGEDLRFIWGTGQRHIEAVPDRGLCIGVIHGANAAPKARSGPFWRTQPVEAVHRLLGASLPFYQKWADGQPWAERTATDLPAFGNAAPGISHSDRRM